MVDLSCQQHKRRLLKDICEPKYMCIRIEPMSDSRDLRHPGSMVISIGLYFL